jgi:3-phenylpropionate/trans-cinnamate dioxygenase ferredoxin subunit
VSDFVKVATTAQLPKDSVIYAEVDGKPVAVAFSRGKYYACQDTCTHEEASLSDGDVFDGIIECPLHGARFDLETGAVKSLPAVIPIPIYEVKVEGDDILVRV